MIYNPNPKLPLKMTRQIITNLPNTLSTFFRHESGTLIHPSISREGKRMGKTFVVLPSGGKEEDE